MLQVLNEKIVEMESLSLDIIKMTIYSSQIAQNILPGQFVNIKCEDGINAYLRRPISVCDIDKINNTVDFVFQVKGKGTFALAMKRAGDYVDLMGPLGTGFDISGKYKNIIVLGGGIGISPLLNLLKESHATTKKAILGFRNKRAIVLDAEFLSASDDLVICTDDGSYGREGFVTEALKDSLETEDADIIYVCGPEGMIKRAVDIANKYGVKCQVSMEQRMGCGIGACLVCVCKTVDDAHPDGWDYSHVCKHGPVFWSQEVIFDD
jgi:dihydroorotate dehydrogenase electron transfer subunit